MQMKKQYSVFLAAVLVSTAFFTHMSQVVTPVFADPAVGEDCDFLFMRTRLSPSWSVGQNPSIVGWSPQFAVIKFNTTGAEQKFVVKNTISKNANGPWASEQSQNLTIPAKDNKMASFNYALKYLEANETTIWMRSQLFAEDGVTLIQTITIQVTRADDDKWTLGSRSHCVHATNNPVYAHVLVEAEYTNDTAIDYSYAYQYQDKNGTWKPFTNLGMMKWTHGREGGGGLVKCEDVINGKLKMRSGRSLGQGPIVNAPYFFEFDVDVPTQCPNNSSRSSQPGQSSSNNSQSSVPCGSSESSSVSSSEESSYGYGYSDSSQYTSSSSVSSSYSSYYSYSSYGSSQSSASYSSAPCSASSESSEESSSSYSSIGYEYGNCTDGIDNDEDGDIDCADEYDCSMHPSCHSSSSSSSYSSESSSYEYSSEYSSSYDYSSSQEYSSSEESSSAGGYSSSGGNCGPVNCGGSTPFCCNEIFGICTEHAWDVCMS